MHRAIRPFLAGAATLAALGACSVPARAGTIHSTDDSPTFAASSSATHTFTVKGGAAVVRATSSTFDGSTTSPETATASIQPVWSGATWHVAGVTYPATVSVSGPWAIASTNAVSPFTGSVTMSATTTITWVGVSGSLVLPSQTKPGLTGFNSGPNFVLGANVSSMAWTASGNVATLLGSSAGNDATFSSSGQNINVTGVNVMP